MIRIQRDRYMRQTYEHWIADIGRGAPKHAADMPFVCASVAVSASQFILLLKLRTLHLVRACLAEVWVSIQVRKLWERGCQSDGVGPPIFGRNCVFVISIKPTHRNRLRNVRRAARKPCCLRILKFRAHLRPQCPSKQQGPIQFQLKPFYVDIAQVFRTSLFNLLNCPRGGGRGEAANNTNCN